MPTPVPPMQRAHRILRRLKCFQADPPCPAGLELKPHERLIGAISNQAFLTESGAYLLIGDRLAFSEYGNITVAFPPKSDPSAALVIRTPGGTTTLLPGDRELWEVGRFFMRCREDERAA